MTLMSSEIKEQPKVLRGMIKTQLSTIKDIAKAVKDNDIKFILTAARGTSNHGCVYGNYMFKIMNGMPTGIAELSVLTHYDATVNFKGTMVIAVSQSGGSTDVCEFLQKAKAGGALAVAFTNIADSRLASIADYTVCFGAGEEKSVAATKTYCGTLAAFYMLSMVMAGKDDNFIAESLETAAKAIEGIFDREEEIKVLSARFRYLKAGMIIARGINYCNALELSLKLTETCYIKMRGFSSAEFLHGPIASLAKADACFVFAPTGKTLGQVSEGIDKLNAKGIETIVFSDDDSILAKAKVPVKMPSVCECIAPMVYIPYGQLLANYLSVSIGNNPDTPEGLTKVCETI